MTKFSEEKMSFNCTHCGHSVTVSKKAAGKRGKCPQCLQAISIPKEALPLPSKPLEETLLFPCPYCKQSMEVSKKIAGSVVICPSSSCQRKIQLPLAYTLKYGIDPHYILIIVLCTLSEFMLIFSADGWGPVFLALLLVPTINGAIAILGILYVIFCRIRNKNYPLGWGLAHVIGFPLLSIGIILWLTGALEHI